MKRVVLAIIALLAICGSARAQEGRYETIEFNSAGRFLAGINVAVCTTLATTAASLTNNVATLTMASNPQTAGFLAGFSMTASGFTGADTYFNTTATIVAVTSTTISFTLVHANASATSNGIVYMTGSTTQACAPLASLFTDNTGAFSSPNPFVSDGLGNVGLWAAAGPYYIQTYSPTVTTSIKLIAIGCVPGSSTSTCGVYLNGNNAFIGNNTEASLNGALNPATCANAPAPSWCSGSDMGAWMNAAYATLPSAGGRIVIPAGSYNFSTPISFSTANKLVTVQGDGSFPTTLTYTGTLSSTAITINNGPGVVTNHPRGHGFRDIEIIGPGGTSTGIGILLGGTNGAEGFKCDGCLISGFNIDVQYANNTWGTEFHNSIIRNGVTNLLLIPNGLTNTGEQLSFVATTFIQDQIGAFTGCITDSFSQAYVTLVDVSVDNCQILVNGGGHLAGSNLHMEWIVAQSLPAVNVTQGIVYGSDFDFLNDSSMSTAANLVSVTGGSSQFIASSVKVNSNGYTFPEFALLSGGAQFDMFGNQGGSFTTTVAFSSFTGSYCYDQMTSSDRWICGTAFSDADMQVVNNTSPNGQAWAIDSQSSGQLSIFPKTNSNATFSLGGVPQISGKTVTTLIASGTASLTNGAITANACAGVVTSAAAGVTTGDTIEWTYTTAPALADGQLVLTTYVTTGNVNFKLCNPTAGSLTPSGLTLNYKVVRNGV